MRTLLLAALLFLPAAAQAQPDTLAFETVHSTAVRPILDFETVVADSEWFPSGSRPADYRFGAGVTDGMLGGDALFIEARRYADSRQMGTLMQMMSSDPWLGKRIRLTARLKSENARQVQLWLRVDGDTVNGTVGHRLLAFYNMADKPISGTTGWRRYEIVLDV